MRLVYKIGVQDLCAGFVCRICVRDLWVGRKAVKKAWRKTLLGHASVQFQDKSLDRSAFTPPPTFFPPTTQITIVLLKLLDFLSKFVKLLLINLACNLYQFFDQSGLF